MEQGPIIGKKKACCQQEENLLPYEEPTAPPDAEVKKCKVCGCRHFVVTMDPGKLGVQGVQL